MLAFLGACSSSFAQTNTFPATGNVGVGTIAPTHSLTFGSGSSGLSIYNTSDQTTNFERGQLFWNSNILNLNTSYGGSATSRNLRITSGGISQLTIGNVPESSSAMEVRRNMTAITSLLAVSSQGLTASVYQQNGLAVIPSINQTGTAGYRGLFISPFEQSLGSGLRNLIDAGTNTAADAMGTHTSKFVVTSDGKIGIGITSPTEKFYIREEGLLRPTFESVTTTDHYRPILDFKRSRGTVAAKLPVVLNDKLGSVYFWGYDGTNYIESSGINGVTESTATGVVRAGLSFATNDGTNLINNSPVTRMYVTASGNVLINPKIVPGGHLDPAATSYDGGKLQVRGLIRAQEIKVETTNWPDFVFAKNYQLPSLQTTEQHILANGHLPGIPSAAEVEKDGIALGEMNKKLLQKIEELTLYLIEMKKENDSTVKKIGQMEIELQKLQTKK